MAYQLDSIRLKIARANEHLHTLDSELSVFLEPYTKSRLVNHQFDGTWHIVSLKPVIQEPVPLLFSIICGEAVHNLRSALDHLIWQLVLAEGNRPGRSNTFPIYSKAKDFETKVRLPRDPKRSPLHGIAPDSEAWALIEKEQPYHRQVPNEHYLATLAMLSNVDKHRALHRQMIYPSAGSMSDAIGWNPAAHLLERKETLYPLLHERETEVLRLRFSEAGPSAQVHVKGQVRLEPTFGDGENFQAAFSGIKQLPVWIARFIEKFVTFFPDHPSGLL